MDAKQERKVNAFLRAVAAAPRSLLLLDYDGTLAGFRVDRFKARPWAGVPQLLAKIQQQGRTQIAVITGRPAAEIPTLLPLHQPIEVWGLHGAQRLKLNGKAELENFSPEVKRALNKLRSTLGKDALGGLFEDKPNAAVMHWRGVPVKHKKLIEERTHKLFSPHTRVDGLRLLKFEAGVELRAGRDKGGAAAELIRAFDPAAPVAYLGDDLTDEAAFSVVNAANAPHLSVLVRRAPRDTVADVWIKPPAELRAFLNRWAGSE